MRLNFWVILSVLYLCITACSTNPANSIVISSILETRREAENNYLKAKQLERDGRYEDAFWMMRRAANGRYGIAANELGDYYKEGIHITKSYRRARHFYFIAAYEADLKSAYLSLADIDFYGKGRPRAVELGYKWMLVGTRGDDGLQEEMRLKMDPEMTSKGIASAHKSAAAWMRARELEDSSKAAQ